MNQGFDPQKLEALKKTLMQMQAGKMPLGMPTPEKPKHKKYSWPWFKQIAGDYIYKYLKVIGALLFSTKLEGIENNEELDKDVHSVIWPSVKYGLIGCAVFIGFFIIWGNLAPLDSAVPAPGQLTFLEHRKTIQSLEGGVVEEIHVEEGSLVKKGDVLLVLNGIADNAELQKVNWAVKNARANETRLLALENGYDEIKLSDDLLNDNSVEATSIVNSQTSLFQSTKSFWKTEDEINGDAIVQAEDQIKIQEESIKSVKEQVKIQKKKLAEYRELVKENVVAQHDLAREELQYEQLLESQQRQLSHMSKLREALSEAKLKKVAIQNKRVNDIEAELKKERETLAAASEEKKRLDDRVGRRTIRSPIDGYALNLKTYTIGGVIGSGAVIMEIVPTDGDLIIEARIPPQAINSITEGLPVKVQLLGYKARLTPRIDGNVIHVGKDIIVDERQAAAPAGPQGAGGGSYYLIKVQVSDEELAKVNDKAGIQMVPGMPVTVFVIRGTRTLIEYIWDPIRTSFFRAFKEA